MNKVYSLFKTKSIDEEKRIITGIATTLSPDRDGDIVVPAGASYTLPIPLLYQHKHDKPIGSVIKAVVTKGGIEVTAQIGQGVDFIEEAWSLIKQGLLGGLSIGFRGTEFEEFKLDSGAWGYKFNKWEWLELSAVTVPANAEATILTVKSCAAIGEKGLTDNRPHGQKPVKQGKVAQDSISLTLNKEKNKMQEQIKAASEKLAALKDDLTSIMAKSTEEGRTLDAEEADSFDKKQAEIKSVSEHLERLKSLEAIAIEKGTPVAGATGKAASDSRSGAISVKSNLPQGMEFVRYVKCLAMAKGSLTQAREIAESRYSDTPRVVNVIKAAVTAGTTTDQTWAKPLVEYNDFAGDFIEFLRPQTILGRFGQGGIPALNSIPFNVRIKGQTSGGSGYWVGESQPKPLTSFDFNTIELGWAKVANIAVLSEELVRLSTPSADLLVRQSLADALKARLDTDFIDPEKAAVDNTSPASVTNGVTPVAASGTDYAAFSEDYKALVTKFTAARIPLSQLVWVMSSNQAVSLSLMQNALGQPSFPGFSMNGGGLMGFPVIVSDYAPPGQITLLAASEVYLADDGQVMIDASREATLEMSDTPTGTATRSMFQHNEIAIRAERYINWAKRRAAAVQFITGAAYA